MHDLPTTTKGAAEEAKDGRYCPLSTQRRLEDDSPVILYEKPWYDEFKTSQSVEKCDELNRFKIKEKAHALLFLCAYLF